MLIDRLRRRAKNAESIKGRMFDRPRQLSRGCSSESELRECQNTYPPMLHAVFLGGVHRQLTALRTERQLNVTETPVHRVATRMT